MDILETNIPKSKMAPKIVKTSKTFVSGRDVDYMHTYHKILNETWNEKLQDGHEYMK